ncbi:oxidoreductase [Actinopolymorpha pittospori]|uniref:NAD(P)-dependent dehydrogenase (Short-subunit alcohol dehydrogenase family) n=1 Tax=Actinopolymorpha pittospori TaxID=648752 RepID=A0A927MTQ7_9ACTN|nr:oxidoreductase [Actinopolymorpha pittospori]MBE1606014.1 NAD(P)-dependent dehydrogenase (short-subunit alcohol dehydrogenase family) [Actinopolymorpha pittospori]
MSVWFVTGASRGLGREIALAALDRGDQVVATGRDADAVVAALDSAVDTDAAVTALDAAPPDLLVVPLDVTDTAQAKNAIDAALTRFGRIDVLVNNAGFGIIGAIEEISDAQTRALFDVNVFGLLTVTRAVLPVLRRQRSGHIVNIGSIGGYSQYPGKGGAGIYAASKFAVEGITEALLGDLDGLGVKATVVEPGSFRTEFLGSSSVRLAADVIDDYEATAGRRRAGVHDENGTQRGDPRKAAEAIVDVTKVENPPTRLQLGPDSVARVEEKIALVAKELDTWRQLGQATDYDDVAA